MANPNFKAISTVSGKTFPIVVTTTAADLVANAAASNKVMKVNALIVSNTTAGSLKINITLKRGATSYHIAKDIAIPQSASFDVMRKHVYLEEGDSIQVQGSAAGLEAVASVEELA